MLFVLIFCVLLNGGAFFDKICPNATGFCPKNSHAPDVCAWQLVLLIRKNNDLNQFTGFMGT